LHLPEAHNRSWERRPVALNFEFNAWAKYPNYKYDAKLGARMAKTAGARVVQPFSGDHRVVLEGGSIDVNGCGTC